TSVVGRQKLNAVSPRFGLNNVARESHHIPARRGPVSFLLGGICRGQAVRSMGKRRSSAFPGDGICNLLRECAARLRPIWATRWPVAWLTAPMLIFPRALCPETLPAAAARRHA